MSIVQRAGDAETKWMNGDIYRLALTGEQTGGGLGLVDATIPPGGGPVPHLHRRSDEHYLVVTGELEFHLDGVTEAVGPGDAVTIPRGTPHGFRNLGIQPARMVFMFTPNGPEGLFSAAGDDPVPATQVMPWGPERLTPELVELAARYDTYVAPPPEA